MGATILDDLKWQPCWQGVCDLRIGAPGGSLLLLCNNNDNNNVDHKGTLTQISLFVGRLAGGACGLKICSCWKLTPLMSLS